MANHSGSPRASTQVSVEPLEDRQLLSITQLLLGSSVLSPLLPAASVSLSLESSPSALLSTEQAGGSGTGTLGITSGLDTLVGDLLANLSLGVHLSLGDPAVSSSNTVPTGFGIGLAAGIASSELGEGPLDHEIKRAEPADPDLRIDETLHDLTGQRPVNGSPQLSWPPPASNPLASPAKADSGAGNELPHPDLVDLVFEGEDSSMETLTLANTLATEAEKPQLSLQTVSRPFHSGTTGVFEPMTASEDSISPSVARQLLGIEPFFNMRRVVEEPTVETGIPHVMDMFKLLGESSQLIDEFFPLLLMPLETAAEELFGQSAAEEAGVDYGSWLTAITVVVLAYEIARRDLRRAQTECVASVLRPELTGLPPIDES